MLTSLSLNKGVIMIKKVFGNKFRKLKSYRDKLFLWKLLKGTLFIKSTLGKVMPLSNLSCLLCHKELEVTEHHFIRCEILQSWWFHWKWNIVFHLIANLDILHM